MQVYETVHNVSYDNDVSVWPLRFVHTARERDQDRYREQDWHNRKQWAVVLVPVLDQCEHFCLIY